MDPTKEKKAKKSLHETIANKKTKKNVLPSRQDIVKLLDENRSRAVAIKLKSMHCEMSDIKNAVLRLDFSKVDVEKLYGLYEVKGTGEEMDKITSYLDDNPEGDDESLENENFYCEKRVNFEFWGVVSVNVVHISIFLHS